MTSLALPALGVGTLARALITLRRKSRPLPGVSNSSFVSEPLDMEHVAQYRRLLRFADDNRVPLTYFYLQAQRAQLAVMLNRAFSFPVPGLVHVENHLRRLGHVDSGRPFEVEVQAIQQPPSESGALYVMLEVLFKQDGVGCVSCSSRYLARRATRKPPQGGTEESPTEAGVLVESWSLPADIGRRYARLSGDFNPIHLWPWSARLFGLKRPIAHGMYSVGKVLAALEATETGPVAGLTARFVKPIPLPGEAQLYRTDGGYRVGSAGNVAVAGTFELNEG